ncbi:secretin and TonB N-terminal domain-containing protein [Mucilaginibacter sp. JRF]|uniref:secretin and TonB N-terminal domain-containing protein n=1 Tax=Mucilaginibacter sp. JRF TaxID=2780088 RepID=UPI001881FB25|nr:secretin and TonB N-terminal domain-containing protein [Mucilaginibacter sp. JRF]MBE9585992.1 secretin and TonB N-terminal domain-containing protein [Mucilaginibacter sp. JRF]
MPKLLRILLICSLLMPLRLFAQQTDRIAQLQENLTTLSENVKGLRQKVHLSVTGVSLQEYLTGLSRSNNLNMSIDPKLNFTIYDRFSDVTATNILVFLAQKYNLDIKVLGSIISVSPYVDPALLAGPKIKDINVSYNQLNNTLSMELQSDSLPAVAKRITQVSGKNVVVPVSLQTKRVTAFISSAVFETALEKMAFTNELKMTKTSDGFYLLQSLNESEELFINNDKQTGVRRAFKPVTPNPGGNAGLYSRVVNGRKLISADATGASIADMVRQASHEMDINYSLYSDIKGSITLHVKDVAFDDFLNILFRGTNYTFHTDNNIYLIGDRQMEGLRTFKVIQLQHRSIDTVMAMIPEDWKRGLGLKEFREQNALLLSGSAAQIAEAEAFIKQLDVLVPVVLIEVTMVDIRKTRTITTGITAGVSDSVKTGGTVLPGLDYTFGSKAVNSFLKSVGRITSTNLGRVTPDFYVRLSALEANENVDVRSVPKLSALNGHTATLSVGSVQYYKNVTQNLYPTTTSTQSVFFNEFKESKADLSIKIKPVVAGDDQVTLGINVDISDFLSIPRDGSPPPRSLSKYETSLRVNNEDMIVLGGIERTEQSESGSGVPFLSRIPVLKWLFSSRSKTNARVVTVLFIKSTIMR